MAAATLPNQAEYAASYLHHLHALTGEIEGAIGAIEANDLAFFSDSVSRQELLAASLAVLTHALGRDAVRSTLRSKSGLALRSVNLQYAALLKHSSQTLTLLSSLCSSHSGHLHQEVRGTRSKRQTWSCEM